MEEINNSIVINHKSVIVIFNILRSIGLKINHRGTKYINKAIQIITMTDNDIVIIENVYKTIATIYGNITPKQVKNDISYALKSRNEEKSENNFERIFGFEYEEYYFTNKTIIEEISRIIKKG